MRLLVWAWLALVGGVGAGCREPAAGPVARAAEERPATVRLAPRGFDPARVVVGLSAGPAGRGPALLRQAGLRPERELEGSGLQLGFLPGAPSAEALAALRRQPGVAFAEADRLVAAATLPSDPLVPAEDVLNTLGLPSAWNTTQGSPSVVIAVLDTGVDATHPDLAGKLVPGWNVVDGSDDTTDPNGHGTAMAGLVAANANDGVGLAGVCPGCRLMPVRVAGADGQASLSAIADGLTWAANHGAQVALVAFGNLSGSAAVQSAAQYFQSLGGVVVAAQGNDPLDSGQTDSPYLLNVGSTQLSHASWGADLDLIAPASAICTAPGGGYSTCAGTSVSAALAAGVVGLLRSAAPALAPDRLQGALFSSASADQPGGARGRWDTTLGYGTLTASGAMYATLNVLYPPGYYPPPEAQASPQALVGPGTYYRGTAQLPVRAASPFGIRSITINDSSNTTLVLASANSSATTLALDTRAFSDGSKQLMLTATDSNGYQTWSSFYLSVDNTPPSLTVNSPSSGATAQGLLHVSAYAHDALSPDPSLRFTATLGGVSCTATGWQPACDLDTTAVDAAGARLVPDGARTLVLTEADGAGNTTTSQVTVNVSNPTWVSIVSPRPGAQIRGVTTVTVAASSSYGPITRVDLNAGSYHVGSATSAPFTFQWDSAAMPGSLTASAVDSRPMAFNSATATAVLDDNNPPAPSFFNRANGDRVSGTVLLQTNSPSPAGWPPTCWWTARWCRPRKPTAGSSSTTSPGPPTRCPRARTRSAWWSTGARGPRSARRRSPWW